MAPSTSQQQKQPGDVIGAAAAQAAPRIPPSVAVLVRADQPMPESPMTATQRHGPAPPAPGPLPPLGDPVSLRGGGRRYEDQEDEDPFANYSCRKILFTLTGIVCCLECVEKCCCGCRCCCCCCPG